MLRVEFWDISFMANGATGFTVGPILPVLHPHLDGPRHTAGNIQLAAIQ